jgi:hypothetical protein
LKAPLYVKEVIEAAQRKRRLVVAKSSKSAIPNAAPIGIIRFVDDEALLIVDNYFLKTGLNLKENPTWPYLAGILKRRRGLSQLKLRTHLKVKPVWNLPEIFTKGSRQR